VGIVRLDRIEAARLTDQRFKLRDVDTTMLVPRDLLILPRGGRIPGGRAREWTISDRFSALSTLAGASFTSADTATEHTSTASMVAMTTSASPSAARSIAPTGGATERR